MSQQHVVPNFKRSISICTLFSPMLFCMVAGCRSNVPARATDVAIETQAVHDLLITQQDDWNDGDINSFMQGYVRSDSLRFASGGTVRYGWETTLERYLYSYPSRDAMGTLEFSDLDIDILSNEWAMAFGAWHLTRGGDFSDIGGLYTLILHREADGWKVMYDHTSQARTASQ